MDSLNSLPLESNRKIKINFAGGDLSSDAGLLLIKEFTCKLDFVKLLKSLFKTNDTALFRQHKDDENGTDYSSTGVVEFMQPLLDEFLTDYPELPLLLRGDSGFAKPEIYDQCETNGVSYVIRLKENSTLRALASDIDECLTETTRNDMVSYAVSYGEFLYQAGSWKHPRRVVCKVEKPTDQLIHMYTFIVTNMDSAPEELIKLYCKRGSMENFIKESKNGFDKCASSR